MKKTVVYHEVTVRFIVADKEVKRAVESSGVTTLKQLVAMGIGGNDMNGLDVDELTVEVKK